METEILKAVGTKFGFVQTIIILLVVLTPQLLTVYNNSRNKKEKEKLGYLLAEQHKERVSKDTELLEIIQGFVNKSSEIMTTLNIFIKKIEDYNDDRKQEFITLIQNLGSRK